MPRLEDREMRYYHTCHCCAHCISEEDGGDCFCVVDLSEEDRDVIWDWLFSGKWTERTKELLDMRQDGRSYESVRGVRPNNSCQFYKPCVYEPEEDTNGEV